MRAGVTDKPLRVLIVEDEALLAMELEAFLEDAGHQVVGIAEAKDEALALAASRRPDVTFMDIHLADGPTGVEAARAVSAYSPTIIFLTANVKRIPPDFAGAMGVIPKPYTHAGFFAALAYIEAAIAGQPTQAPASFLVAGRGG